jgi:hypothetical protein
MPSLKSIDRLRKATIAEQAIPEMTYNGSGLCESMSQKANRSKNVTKKELHRTPGNKQCTI